MEMILWNPPLMACEDVSDCSAERFEVSRTPKLKPPPPPPPPKYPPLPS